MLGNKFTDVFPSDPKPRLETVDESIYFNDPVLTLEDSIVYGCSMRLNKEELKNFCDGDNTKWTYLEIFQNIYDLDFIGVAGDSNPHFK